MKSSSACREKVATLRTEVQEVLENNILSFWLEQMQDHEHGGFYGQMTGRGELVKTADKGAILNARILWAFSAAYRVLRKPEYLEAATRAKDYILDHFIDPEYGGTYWSLDYLGQPRDTKKQFYAIGFMIYGRSEYARATGDHEALDVALQLYECIEEHSLDHEYNGYIEAMTRDWQPIADMRLSEKDENGVFTMNTHLHVLEAYTNLYRVLKNVQRDDVQGTKERVERQLRTLIDIFATRIFDPATGHLMLFFDESWQPSNTHTSPGHDIEAAWLLHEALEVFGDEELLNQTLPVIYSLAQAAEDGILRESEWWCFAEAVVGYIDQWQLLLDEDPQEASINYELAQAAYEFIQNRLLDREHGEWFWSVLADGTPDLTRDKSGFWKCPYHNSRMCFEMMERCAQRTKTATLKE